MPKKECRDLVALGMKLTTLGYKVDGIRDKIRRTYLKSGMKEEAKLQKLVDEYNSANAMWLFYEAKYLELKEKIELGKAERVNVVI